LAEVPPMTKYAPPSIWTDEYKTPSVDGLRKLVVCDAKKAFDKTRSKLHALGEVREELKWFGDCWYWSIAFISEETDDLLALMIPSPEDLQIASQLTLDFIDQLSTRRLKRFVRDGLELAMPPYQTNWAVWSIPTPAAVEDVMPVMKSKFKFYSS